MADPAQPAGKTPDVPTAPGPARSPDEISLELMKFIAVATGYGKASQSSTGFSGKPVARSAEEQADALLDLFERCRRMVRKEQ